MKIQKVNPLVNHYQEFERTNEVGLSEWRHAGRTARGRRSTGCRGFTLVELLVVIAIIGILVAAVAAGGQRGTRGGPPHAVSESPQADWVGILESRVRAWAPARRAAGVGPGPEIQIVASANSRRAVGPTTSCPYIEQQDLHGMGSDGKPDEVTPQQKQQLQTRRHHAADR